MDQRVMPTPRIRPLPPDHTPELKEHFDAVGRNLGFIPNSLLIMQRHPRVVKAFAQLIASVWAPDGKVDRGLKRLIAHVASRTAGCRYCMAHTAGGALIFGVNEEKVAAVWDYQTSPLYTPAERAALDLALAAAQVPNETTDAHFAELRKHWSEDEILEIIEVIAMFGFLNRWNDTLSTPLESEAVEVGERLLSSRGWSVGKHVAV
jgi:uncharacterized peroxidase-related enzyme